MMGIWFLVIVFFEILVVLFGKFVVIDVFEGEVMNIVVVVVSYEYLFWLLMWIGLGCVVVVLLCLLLLKRMMYGVK